MGRIKGKVIIKKDDIVGKTYGKLLVLSHKETYYDYTGGGERMRHSYMCKCECGNVKEVRRSSLLCGITRSCGCIMKGRKRWR